MIVKGIDRLPQIKPFTSDKKIFNSAHDNKLLFIQLVLNDATLIHNSKLLKEIDGNSSENYAKTYFDKITGLTEYPNLHLIFFQFWEFLSTEDITHIKKTIFINNTENQQDIIYSINEFNYTKNKVNPEILFVTDNFLPNLEQINISNDSVLKVDLYVLNYCNSSEFSQLNFVSNLENVIKRLKINGDLILKFNIEIKNIIIFFPLLLYFFDSIKIKISDLYEPYPYDIFVYCTKLKITNFDFTDIQYHLVNDNVCKLFDYNNKSLTNYFKNVKTKSNLYIKKVEDTAKLIRILPENKISTFVAGCIKSQIINGRKWCDKFSIQLNRYYSIFENDPVLISVSEIIARRFPPNDYIDKSKLQMTDIGIYSYTPYYDTEKMIEYCKPVFDRLDNLIITESNGGIGGDTLTFAKYFKKINCFENRPLHCDIIRNNLSVYGYNNVTVYCWDYTDAMHEVEQDILYMDPPWGGPAYRLASKMSLYINKLSIEEIILKIKARFYILKAPMNFDIEKLMKTVNPTYLKVLDLKKYQVFFLKK